MTCGSTGLILYLLLWILLRRRPRAQPRRGVAPIDVIGRRLYSGLVVAGLLAGSAHLLAAGATFMGVAFFVFALGWGGGHTLLTLWLGRKGAKK